MFLVAHVFTKLLIKSNFPQLNSQHSGGRAYVYDSAANCLEAAVSAQ